MGGRREGRVYNYLIWLDLKLAEVNETQAIQKRFGLKITSDVKNLVQIYFRIFWKSFDLFSCEFVYVK